MTGKYDHDADDGGLDPDIVAKALTNLRRSLFDADIESAETVREARGQKRQGHGQRPAPRGRHRQSQAPAGSLFEQAVAADHDDRPQARRLRAAYWAALGEPPDCGPGEVAEARAFYHRVCQVLEDGGWDRSERSGLERLARRWRGRADGSDVRFVLAGNQPGRLPRGIEARLKVLKDGRMEP